MKLEYRIRLARFSSADCSAASAFSRSLQLPLLFLSTCMLHVSNHSNTGHANRNPDFYHLPVVFIIVVQPILEY